jgi:PBP1b-binding outer membrane lipoprotein LpoB
MSNRSRPAIRRRHAMTVALVVLLAGCSGSKPAGQAAAQATDQAAAAGQATDDTSAAAAGGTNGYDPCQKLTVAQVQPFFTAPIQMKKEDDLIGPMAGRPAVRRIL